jgi:hypothetical protein
MREPTPESKGFRGRPLILDYVGGGALEEDEAQEEAREIVRHAREGSLPLTEGPAPDPDEVRERRRRRQEARASRGE